MVDVIFTLRFCFLKLSLKHPIFLKPQASTLQQREGADTSVGDGDDSFYDPCSSDTPFFMTHDGIGVLLLVTQHHVDGGFFFSYP